MESQNLVEKFKNRMIGFKDDLEKDIEIEIMKSDRSNTANKDRDRPALWERAYRQYRFEAPQRIYGNR